MCPVHKPILFGIGIVLLMQGVSAFSLSTVSIEPPNIINPGDAVNVSYTVYAASGTAFPLYNDLQFVTPLENNVWTFAIVINGVENVRPVDGGRTLTISGYELSYQDRDEVLVRVRLSGRIPSSSVPGSTRTLVTIKELDARGYAINSSTVTIDHLIGTPTPTPTPAFGSISVTSDPAGANVYLDNVYRGFTPLTLDAVPNGNHRIVLRLDRYAESSRTLHVSGESQSVHVPLSTVSTTPPATASSLQPTDTGQPAPAITVPAGGTGSLSITTIPPGAVVHIDGEIKGVTPATIPGLAPGKHAITLVRGGYSPLNTTILIDAGKTTEFSTGLSESTKASGFGIASIILSILALYVFQNAGYRR